MLTFYIIALLIGGGLIVLSLFGGDHSHDADVDHDTHFEMAEWVPFFSMRFWTYFCAVFGAGGLLLTYLTDTPTSLIPILSSGAGLVSGLLTFMVMRLSRRAETNSGSSLEDTLGLEGQVLVAVRPGQPGRVRCNVRGDLIDYLALPESGQAMEVGSKVIVVAVENDMLKVVSKEALFEEHVTVGS